MIKLLTVCCLLWTFSSYAGRPNFISDTNTVKNMEPKWKFKTGGKIHSSACSSGNLVYFGDEDNHVYALDKYTGKMAWSFATGGAVNSSPAISGNSLFFLSMDGVFYALNAETGKLIWSFKTGGEKKIDIWDYYLSDPVVNEGLVYFGSSDSSIYALQTATGLLKWRYKTEGSIHAKPVIHHDSLYVGNFAGYFYAFDALKGSLLWKFRTIGDSYFPNGEIQKGALFHNGLLWFGTRDYNLYAINPTSGRGAWNMKESGSWIIATPFASDQYIYFGTSDSHAFYCMDAGTGQVKWKMKLNMRVYGSAGELGNLIYFGCFNGKLYGVEKLTGKVSKIFQTEKSKENYFTVYDSTDQFRKGFSIYGNNAEEFKLAEEKIMALGSIMTNPLMVDDTIYFGSADGYFYALKP